MSLPALLDSTLDILFPRRCQACSVFLEHPLSGARKGGLATWLCPDCRAGLEPCEPGLIRLPAAAPEQVFSGYLYAGPLAEIIPAWKYHRRYDLFPLITALCRESLSRWVVPESEIDLVVAVPLSSRALRKRGFNQSRFIAEKVAGILNCRPAPGVLKKVVETPRQATLDRPARQSNLDRRVFRVADPAAVRGGKVLVCDDVMTTGTTLRVAAAVLREAGAAAVVGFTLARVP